MNVCMYDRIHMNIPVLCLFMVGECGISQKIQCMHKYKVSLKLTFPFEALPGDNSLLSVIPSRGYLEKLSAKLRRQVKYNPKLWISNERVPGPINGIGGSAIIQCKCAAKNSGMNKLTKGINNLSWDFILTPIQSGQLTWSLVTRNVKSTPILPRKLTTIHLPLPTQRKDSAKLEKYFVRRP
jgi:hypothetical protein